MFELYRVREKSTKLILLVDDLNYNELRQWIHIAEGRGLGVAALELCSHVTIRMQELPLDYPREQFEAQSYEPKVNGQRESQFPIRVRKWRGAEA